MKKVFVIGGTTFDSIIYLNNLPKSEPQTIFSEKFNETIGSTGAGKSLNLTKLRVPNTLHSIIGQDIYGEKIVEALKKDGVSFIYDIDPNGTERHVNLMDDKGGRISIFVTHSSSELSLDMNRLEEEIKNSDIIVLNIISYTKSIIPLLEKYKKPVWVDLHDYEVGNVYHEDFINIADYIFVSSDNLENYKPVMERWITMGKELVVCTHGKNGSTALTKEGKWIETPIIDAYEFIDANGAGDSFFSGFLYYYLKNKPIEECLRVGTICAGLCISSQELAYEDLSEELIFKEYAKYFNR